MSITATHIGTKLIAAEPMTRAQWCEFRGWTLPADENGDDEGFLVEYLDGGKPNVPGREGYVSWSPKEVFEKSYRPISGLTFGLAIEALKLGKKVARAGWNGKGMFIFLIPGSTFTVNRAPLRPHIAMKGVDGSISEWTPAAGNDVLAEDWQVVE